MNGFKVYAVIVYNPSRIGYEHRERVKVVVAPSSLDDAVGTIFKNEEWNGSLWSKDYILELTNSEIQAKLSSTLSKEGFTDRSLAYYPSFWPENLPPQLFKLIMEEVVPILSELKNYEHYQVSYEKGSSFLVLSPKD